MKRPSKWRSAEKWWTGGIVPIDVGRSLRIVPYWESWRPRSDRHDLIIDPGASFGAGDHPTTIIALQLLEKIISDLFIYEKAISLLDIGTGTGVLAIGAKALGCDFVVACDVDPCAIHLAQRNVNLNSSLCRGKDLQGIDFYVGPIDVVRSGFNIVIANLAAPVLLRLKTELLSRSKSYLVLSGIPDPMFDLVRDDFSVEGIRLEGTISLNEWNGFIFRKL